MKKYSRDEIRRSKEFGAYQPDFLAAVLDREEYTLADAKKAVKTFFKAEKEGK